MSLFLRFRVVILRFLLRVNERAERRQHPVPPQHTFTETIPSPSRVGSVKLYIYIPNGFRDATSSSNTRHPLVVNFHGGGFTAGSVSMDDRWIGNLLNIKSQPVVVGIDYGLAPENPFPGAIQDAVAAISWLVGSGADKYRLDTQRVVLAGFSAGGTLALSAALWSKSTGDDARLEAFPSLRGILCAYPGIDYRIPRHNSGSVLSRFLTRTWDDAYFNRSPLDSPFVSPAAADDGLLQAALPDHIALYPSSHDELRDSCESFRERLLQLGKRVTGQVEQGTIHAWDKYPIKQGDTARWEKRKGWFDRMSQDIEHMLEV